MEIVRVADGAWTSHKLFVDHLCSVQPTPNRFCLAIRVWLFPMWNACICGCGSLSNGQKTEDVMPQIAVFAAPGSVLNDEHQNSVFFVFETILK